jgi:hypothetical protein
VDAGQDHENARRHDDADDPLLEVARRCRTSTVAARTLAYSSPDEVGGLCDADLEGRRASAAHLGSPLGDLGADGYEEAAP